MPYTGNAPAYNTFPVWAFTSTGVESYTNPDGLNASSSSSVLVSLDGRHAYASTYTAQGTSLRFNAPYPAAGVSIEVLYLGTPAISQALQGLTSITLDTTNLKGVTVSGSTAQTIITNGTFALAGTLAVSNGGTGNTLFGANQLLIGAGSSSAPVTPNPIASLPTGTSGQYLQSRGPNSAPIWFSPVTTLSGGTTGLTPATASTGDIVLDGTLNVTNGGTGLATLTQNAILLGNGTSSIGIVTGSTNIGEVLTNLAGNSAPTWADGTRVAQITSSLSGITLTSSPFSPQGSALSANTVVAINLNGTMMLSGLVNIVVGSVISPTSSSLTRQTISLIGPNNTVKVTSSAGWGSPGAVSTPDVYIWNTSALSPVSNSVNLGGTLGVANGGTGLASITANALMVGNDALTLTVLPTGSAGQVLTSSGAGANPSWIFPVQISAPSISALGVGQIVLGIVGGSTPPAFPVPYGTTIVVDGSTVTLLVSGAAVPPGTYRSLGTVDATGLGLWIRTA